MRVAVVYNKDRKAYVCTICNAKVIFIDGEGKCACDDIEDYYMDGVVKVTHFKAR